MSLPLVTRTLAVAQEGQFTGFLASALVGSQGQRAHHPVRSLIEPQVPSPGEAPGDGDGIMLGSPWGKRIVRALAGATTHPVRDALGPWPRSTAGPGLEWRQVLRRTHGDREAHRHAQ